MGATSTSRPSRVLLVALAAAVLLVLLATGCALFTDEPVLTQDDSGTTLVIQKGDTFVVELASNPSTGYAWALDGELPEVVTLSGDAEYVEPESDALGAAGVERWTFEAAEVGTGEVYLRYWRASDPETENEQTFMVEVTVREP